MHIEEIRKEVNDIIRPAKKQRKMEKETQFVIFGTEDESTPTYIFCFDDQVETVIQKLSSHSNVDFAIAMPYNPVTTLSWHKEYGRTFTDEEWREHMKEISNGR